jgi:hypothetical protein
VLFPGFRFAAGQHDFARITGANLYYCQKTDVCSKTRGMGLILLIIVILLLIGAFPTGGYGFGYRSHGLLGTILIIILILWLLGRI